jgi:hypothetical protein
MQRTIVKTEIISQFISLHTGNFVIRYKREWSDGITETIDASFTPSRPLTMVRQERPQGADLSLQ